MKDSAPEWYTRKLYSQLKYSTILSAITVTFIHIITGRGELTENAGAWIGFLLFSWILYRASDYIFPEHAKPKDS